MLKYTIIIISPPLSKPNMTLAKNATADILAKGNHINSVFFWQDGIYSGFSGDDYPSDEFNPFSQWQALSKTFSIPLEVCTTSLSRRGLKEKNLDSAFKISTLAQLTERMNASDIVLTF